MTESRAAAQAQWRLTANWLRRLPSAGWTRSSMLDGWTVADLVAHLGMVFRLLAGIERSTDRPFSAGGYVAGYQSAAAEIATAAVRFRARHGATELLALVDAEATAAWVHLDAFLPSDPSDVIRPVDDSIRLDDYLATRVVELVVHTDDLARSLPDLPPPGLDEPATAIAVRTLLDVLAERAPGRSVEVRVPPHAAVQCIEGPRHSRDTPPNVVETDPLTWLRLAAGRVTWAEARDRVSASGERADLSPYLPLI